MDEFITILNDKIREQVSPIVYIIWLSDLDYLLENGVLEIKSPNQFKSNVVKNEFSDLFKDVISELLSENIKLRFTYWYSWCF